MRFTKKEVGLMIGILSNLDPEIYEEDAFRAIIYKAKSLYGPTIDGKRGYKTYTV